MEGGADVGGLQDDTYLEIEERLVKARHGDGRSSFPVVHEAGREEVESKVKVRQAWWGEGGLEE